MPMPTIGLEEHFISSALAQSASVATLRLDKFKEDVRRNLPDVGSGRIANLDKGGVTFQVISSVPCNETPDICHRTNLELAAAVKEYPTRFAGFACLPMGDPQAATEMLDYCVRELRFKGALIPSHVSGTYYDGAEYLGFWEKVQELDTVIYIHPAPASPLQREYYKGNYDDHLAHIMGMQVWGWHADVGTHIIRLYASGLFDKLPRLKIVIGHMGEMLPFMKTRIDYTTKDTWGAHNRDWLKVWEENLWFTTSMFDLTAMACLLRAASIERILYSGDYPLIPWEEGKQFIEDLSKSDLVNEAELQKILYRNAQALLGIQLEGES